MGLYFFFMAKDNFVLHVPYPCSVVQIETIVSLGVVMETLSNREESNSYIVFMWGRKSVLE